MLRSSRTETRRTKRGSRLRVIGSIAVACGVFLSACNTTGVGFDYETKVARFVVETEQQGAVISMPVSGARIRVNPRAVLSEYDIVNVDVADLELGPCLQFTLTRQASLALYRTSVNNLGKFLVLLVDGKPLGLRRMERPISNGIIHMFVEVPDADLPDLAKDLRGTSIEVKNTIGG